MKSNLYVITFLSLFLCVMTSSAQIIITVAGNHELGYYGDGGPALEAEFNWPASVAVDTVGNMYIADLDNNVIREVSASGFVTTFAGSGSIGYEGDGFSAYFAKFNYPTGVAVDKKGNVYIADQFNHVVRKVNDTGIMSTYAGSGYEASTGPGGYSGDGGQATNARFYSPESIAFDAAGNLYISDIGNSTVRKVDVNGITTTVAGINTDTGYSGDGSAATAAKLNQPSGMTVDGAGNLYIADQYNNVIRKVNAAGTISTVAGNGYNAGSIGHLGGYSGDGGQATAAELWLPSGVAIDALGNLYISDEYNMVIREVNTSGIITTIAGNGTGGYSGDWGSARSAELNFPQGIAIDKKQNLLIADFNNNVIRKVNTGTTAIHEVAAATGNVHLVHNPNNGVFLVNGSLGSNTDQPVSLEVMDMQGQVVYSNTIMTQNGNINAQVALNESLSDGMYILRVNAGGENSIFRFVVER